MAKKQIEEKEPRKKPAIFTVDVKLSGGEIVSETIQSTTNERAIRQALSGKDDVMSVSITHKYESLDALLKQINKKAAK
jgi:ABC-type uncharacterized transport system substrate-binding protein